MDNLFYKIALAETQTSINADTLLDNIADKIINPFIGILLAFAIVIFLYGVTEFIAGADNEDKRSQGKQHIIWGLVGLFIMVSVFGLMRIIISFWEGI